VGREGHTYYWHICENYDRLSEYTYFLQGDPQDHCTWHRDFSEELWKHIRSPDKKGFETVAPRHTVFTSVIGCPNLNYQSLDIYKKIFGVDKYVMRLSLHDPAKLGQKYINEPELWQETEAMVREVLIESNIPFVEVQDEGAFYGPKIDVQIWSAIGREFTLATNQVDFAQGRRFNLQYTNKDNHAETPLIIHRAPLGTHERFIGFLLEHYAGKFPLWLSPIQVKVLPISDKFNEYAQSVNQQLLNAGIRSELDDRAEKIGKKIRDTELMKVPYMLIIGEKEQTENAVSVRRQGKGDAGMSSLSEILTNLTTEIRDRQSNS
jgi:threonyl-tRNA synthetase